MSGPLCKQQLHPRTPQNFRLYGGVVRCVPCFRIVSLRYYYKNREACRARMREYARKQYANKRAKS